MERSELTRRIKEKARQQGFDAVGVAPLRDPPSENYREWLARGYHGQMGYMEGGVEKRLDPGRVLEGARSVVSLALNYNYEQELPYDRPDCGVISRYASATDYHLVLEEELRELMEFVVDLDAGIRGKYYVDTGPVLDKFWAARSGIGWLGKHTNVLSRWLGSWFFVGEILFDVELDYDPPGQDYCGSCTRCIEACPTGAIVEPYVLDGRRCISYLTIELREDIPEEFRPAMGNLVFGCDICQDVCPWNREAPASRVREFEPWEANRAPQLRELVRLSPEEFRDRYRRSPVKRAKWRGFMRNVAVAMGNSGDPALVPGLRDLLNTDDAMVRRHAAWALARLGTPEALQALRRRRSRESDPQTLQVLDSALETAGGSPSTHITEKGRFRETNH